MNLYFKYLLILAISATALSAELVKTYFFNGELKAETNYIDGTNTDIKVGIKNGVEKIYYEMGKLAYKVNYKKNKRDGELLWYDKEGHKLADRYYKNSKLEGLELTYFANGKIKHSAMYKNDKKDGYQKEYFDNGILASIVMYKNNKKEGIEKEYMYDAKLYSEVMYKNNYKEGIQKWYGEKGKIIKTELFKMDRPLNVMKEIEAKKNDVNILIDSIDFSPKKAR